MLQYRIEWYGLVFDSDRCFRIQKFQYIVDAHGEVKYNAWEKPTQISKWKEEHVGWVVLSDVNWVQQIFDVAL